MIITPEQFSTAYGKLPFPIREYLAGDELGEVTEAVGKEFGLHIDTVGALDREVTNMLLGLINPEQFVGELRSVGIPQENISALVKELNAKVFMPLREKMQNAPPEPAPQPEVSAPIEEVAPMMQAPIITPAPVYVAPPAYTSSSRNSDSYARTYAYATSSRTLCAGHGKCAHCCAYHAARYGNCSS
jgi:hypothetical protein